MSAIKHVYYREVSLYSLSGLYSQKCRKVTFVSNIQSIFLAFVVLGTLFTFMILVSSKESSEVALVGQIDSGSGTMFE